ncbi:GIY-YIG nuclease family protein [Pseudothermotoga thermarum]|uniref:GIY-YIG domain-containing protein n=1 Tax=Pseudothermotoga thermarum DSM 5069 TaxID=688269 RepID=F7YVY4_9THEM|nr:GIY-YIG nuclease family protein [Pseudothermotoga thermarum]AEH51813.1 protein of unknown function DUF123 [Pseudothermotoga thermarum DSM 5069]
MSKGTYILVVKLEKDRTIKSKAKSWNLSKGLYAYVGSAMNNLEKRIERHLRKNKKMHWHVDYLLKEAKVLMVIEIPSNERLEEKVARYLEKFFEPVKDFGSTDVKTKGNLFKISSAQELIKVMDDSKLFYSISFTPKLS